MSAFAVCLWQKGDYLNTATPITPDSGSDLKLSSLHSVGSTDWQTFCHTFLLKDWFYSFKLISELVGHFMVWILCHFPQTPMYQTLTIFSVQLLIPVSHSLSPVCTSFMEQGVGTAFVTGHQSRCPNCIPQILAESRGHGGGGVYGFCGTKEGGCFSLEMSFHRVCSKLMALS